MNRRRFALALAMTPGIGGRSVTRILSRCDLLGISATEFFALSPEGMMEEFRLTKKQAAALTKHPDQEAFLAPIQERLEKHGVRWVTLADAHYPERVEQYDSDPPGVLFLYGSEKLLTAKTFAVLSSRDTSPAGMDQLEALTENGVLGGEVLVSGHDTPEYQRSALVPLRYGAPRILVLDRGFFPVLGDSLTEEPFRAARLWRFQFDPRTDLVVSPFRPWAEYAGINNQVRDRLIGSLALRMDLVEVSPAGNMEKLARMALKASRPVRVSDRTIGYRVLGSAGAEIISA